MQCDSQAAREDDETAFHKICNVTHLLLVIGKDVMSCLSQNVQCCSLAAHHRIKCDESAFCKMCNVTHLLLVIGKGVMRLHFTCHSLAVS